METQLSDTVQRKLIEALDLTQTQRALVRKIEYIPGEHGEVRVTFRSNLMNLDRLADRLPCAIETLSMGTEQFAITLPAGEIFAKKV